MTLNNRAFWKKRRGKLPHSLEYMSLFLQFKRPAFEELHVLHPDDRAIYSNVFDDLGHSGAPNMFLFTVAGVVGEIPQATPLSYTKL